MKIKPIYIITLAITIIALAFAFVLYQENNRKMDIQEKKYKEEQATIIQKEKERAMLALALYKCIDLADVEYWNYVKLNGTDLGNGEYRAFTRVWDNAQKRKDKAVEICKLKYSK